MKKVLISKYRKENVPPLPNPGTPDKNTQEPFPKQGRKGGRKGEQKGRTICETKGRDIVKQFKKVSVLQDWRGEGEGRATNEKVKNLSQTKGPTLRIDGIRHPRSEKVRRLAAAAKRKACSKTVQKGVMGWMAKWAVQIWLLLWYVGKAITRNEGRRSYDRPSYDSGYECHGVNMKKGP